MGLMTPAAYVASLNDGREIYLDGERIADVGTHPAFRFPVAIAAKDYQYSGEEAVRTYEADDGSRANRIFQVPRSQDDLEKRMEFLSHASIVTGVTGVFMALMSVRDAVGARNERYAANIERVYKHMRDNDLRAAEVITDPKGDRKRRANEQDDLDLYLRIVERKDEGIVVRGAKLHITGASLVHELVVMPTKGMKPEETDYAVSFSIPVNTKGIKIINRSVLNADTSDLDQPYSIHHAVPEGFVIFDDVLIPWDRVFLAGESELASPLAQSLGLWERAGSLAEYVHQSRVFVGLAQLASEMQGKEKDPSVQASIAELSCYAEMVRMGLDDACRNFETAPTGMVYPNNLSVNATKYYYADNYHVMIKRLHDLGGGLVVTMPREKDLANPDTGSFIRKYLHTKPEVDVDARIRVLNTIRDMTADAFGGLHQVATLQAGGGLSVGRLMINRLYDMKQARAEALSAAGIAPKSSELTFSAPRIAASG